MKTRSPTLSPIDFKTILPPQGILFGEILGSSWFADWSLGCLRGFRPRSFKVLLGYQLLDSKQRDLGCVFVLYPEVKRGVFKGFQWFALIYGFLKVQTRVFAS